MLKKPIKKADPELFILIEQKIKQNEYIFLNHVKQRQQERKISDLDVLNILAGKQGCERTRNKSKDIYEPQYINENPQDWKYCIEGKDIDGKKVRIIITFTDSLCQLLQL